MSEEQEETLRTIEYRLGIIIDLLAEKHAEGHLTHCDCTACLIMQEQNY